MSVTRLLVTACNVGRFASSMSAVMVDLSSREAHLVDIESTAKSHVFQGMTGIVEVPGGWAVGLQMRDSAVALLDRQWTLRRVVRLQSVKDIHSIVRSDSALLIASTGTNRLVRLDLESGAESVVWDAEATAERDVTHLNGACVHAGQVIVSQFGASAGNTVRAGAVVITATGNCLLGGLREPHSVFSDGNDLWVLESLTGSLLKLRSGEPPELVARVRGYARGLYIDDELMAIGVSGSRTESRASGVNRPIESALCGAPGAWLDITRGEERFQIDLSGVASEIYDIVPLRADVAQSHAVPLMARALEQAWGAFRFGRLDECRSLLEQAPASLGRAMLMCQVAAMRGDQEAELAAGAEAESIAPELAEAVFRKSCALLKNNRPAQAVLLMEQLLASHPTEPTYLEHAASVYLRLGQLRSSWDVLMRARTVVPASPHIAGLAAWVALQQGDLQQALVLAGEALAQSPPNLHAHRARCQALANLGEVTLAAEAVSKAQSFYPRDAMLLKLSDQLSAPAITGP
jgi:Flp pilus assembly protein TadD